MRVSSKGFTLSEVILSVGLLAVSLLAVIGLFTAAIRYQAQLQENSQATTLATRILERIRSEPNTVPPAPAAWYGGQLAFTPIVVGPPTFPPAPYPYQDGYSVDVLLENTTRPGMKLVKVELRWDGGRKLGLQTLISE